MKSDRFHRQKLSKNMHVVLNVHVILFKRFKQIITFFLDVKIYEVNKQHIAFIPLQNKHTRTHTWQHSLTRIYSIVVGCMLVCENAFK